MPVPSFEAFLLPMLRLAADGKEHSLAELRPPMQAALALSDADLAEMLPSGKQSKFANRVAWASVYLVKAGGLLRIRRGVMQITERGNEMIRENPNGITLKILLKYPEIVAFAKGSSSAEAVQSSTVSIEAIAATITPEEQLEASYQTIREAVASDLLEQMHKSKPAFFERLVVELLVAMGYGGSVEDAGKAVGRAGDGGIDGIIKEDKLGLDSIYIQAKKWEANVGRPEVQAFCGSLDGHHARKGVFITASDFSANAIDYVKGLEKKIVLVNGKALAELMIDHNVGVTSGRSYTVKKVDLDYFDEE